MFSVMRELNFYTLRRLKLGFWRLIPVCCVQTMCPCVCVINTSRNFFNNNCHVTCCVVLCCVVLCLVFVLEKSYVEHRKDSNVNYLCNSVLCNVAQYLVSVRVCDCVCRRPYFTHRAKPWNVQEAYFHALFHVKVFLL